MTRLINPQFLTTRERNLGHAAPRLLLNVANRQPFLSQLDDGGLDVVAHQVQLVVLVALRRVNGKLGRGRGKDQPAMPGVDRRKVENIAKEPTSVVILLRVNECVYADDSHDGP